METTYRATVKKDTFEFIETGNNIGALKSKIKETCGPAGWLVVIERKDGIGFIEVANYKTRQPILEGEYRG